jgi:DNA-binding HxlR family transcriptional regulator
MARRASSGSSHPSRRSNCPIACSLDLLGDRWTLVIIRDLFRGRARFGELLASPEAIPTNILADRLRRLEEQELIAAEPYQHHPVRYAYRLTAKGQDLKPVLASLAGWAHRHLPKVQPDPAMLTLLRG